MSVKPSFFIKGWTCFNDFIIVSAVNIGSFLVESKACSPAYFMSITKSAAIKPDVSLATYDICSSVKLLFVVINNFLRIFYLLSSLLILIEKVLSNRFNFFKGISSFYGFELVAIM